MQTCPGRSRQFWRPEDIYDLPCPHCGREVELFKTDIERRCPHCGGTVLNPRADLSCAEWCPSAKECLGPVLYGRLKEKEREEDLERLLSVVGEDVEVRELFLRLFRENRDPERLFDPDLLKELEGERPDLVERATKYYAEFRKKVG
ncbi:MAG: hypothetical protein DRP99_00190 [Candidatus Latescibacterota bacterium]|nr:MAG: hypothetical protein DRP99_00190 [Candidatus Latescibacterota bacterium]